MIPDGWKIEKVTNFCKRVTDGTHDTPKPVVGDGVPLITSKNLKGGELSFNGCYNISLDDAESINTRSKVDHGDVLLGMIGTIGNPTIVSNSNFDFVIKNIALFKTGGNFVDAYWLKLFFESHRFEYIVNSQQTGNAQKFLSLGFLRSLTLLRPPPPRTKENRPHPLHLGPGHRDRGAADREQQGAEEGPDAAAPHRQAAGDGRCVGSEQNRGENRLPPHR